MQVYSIVIYHLCVHGDGAGGPIGKNVHPMDSYLLPNKEAVLDDFAGIHASDSRRILLQLGNVSVFLHHEIMTR